MQSNKHIFVATTLALAAGLGLPSTADAVGQEIVNATGVCNGALPAFEGALRKRPLAIANEGTSPAFVNCSLTTDGQTNLGYSLLGLFLVNRNAAPVAVNCTFVDGAATEIAGGALGPTYYPRLIALPAGGVGSAGWAAENEGVEQFTVLANFSCNLPPGVEINVVTGAFITPL